MLKINKETTQTSESTYVNGWFNGKLFEFTHFTASGEFEFGTKPFIGGNYVECKPLPVNEQENLKRTWLTR